MVVGIDELVHLLSEKLAYGNINRGGNFCHNRADGDSGFLDS